MESPKIETSEMGDHKPISEGPVERLCCLLSEVALFVMVAVVAVDILTRTLLNYSFEISDEVAGYMLVGLAFFSLAVTQVNDGFHRVGFLQDLLSQRARLISRVVFDVVTLIFVGILLWIFAKYGMASWRSGAVAPTRLMTPLWIAQLPMSLGLVAFALAILRTVIVSLRRLGSLKHGAGDHHGR